jgi:DNA-directed RNA polymerase subunit F
MKVKGVISEERITLPELRESLLEMEGQRSGEGKEMSYELRRSIEHSNQLAKNTPEQSRMLVGELLKLEKMKPDIAFRITNVMEPLQQKGFDFRLDNLGELLRITKYNHGWSPSKKKSPEVTPGL